MLALATFQRAVMPIWSFAGSARHDCLLEGLQVKVKGICRPTAASLANDGFQKLDSPALGRRHELCGRYGAAQSL